MNKDRFISKMFLRGDSVVLVLRNPLGGPGPGKPASVAAKEKRKAEAAAGNAETSKAKQRKTG